jgi:hypothetical protein
VAECRFCAAPLRRTLVDLGTSPLANSFPSEHQQGRHMPGSRIPVPHVEVHA